MKSNKIKKLEAVYNKTKDRSEKLEKLHWSRMTPEQRKREIESNDRVRKILENEREIEEKFEKNLTKDQLELRKNVKEFINFLAGPSGGFYWSITAKSVEEAAKKMEPHQEKAKKMLEDILKKADNNPKEILKVLCEVDTVGMVGTPMSDFFIQSFESYIGGKDLILYFLHIEG